VDLDYLIFSDPGDSGIRIENTIHLKISAFEYDKLRSTTGEKVEIGTRKIIINGDTLEPNEVSTRGKSTLMFKRKSLNFKLKSKASFRHGDRTESLKKFCLLSLSMDRYYCRNRLAFEMMDTLGIFNLFYSFCELRINDKSEGVFMIVERPEDWALKERKSPLVLRRGYGHKIEKIKAENKADRAATKGYVDNYRQIYRSLGDYEGEELYAVLLEYIDLDFYMRWLAFNYLVHNGDYSDEVFFYLDPEIKKYRIIPWDYDDIFATTPHEGSKQRNEIMGGKLMFSTEDLLDKKIATDPFLYEVYLKCLKEVLETLSPDLLKQVIQNSYAELYPFYKNEEIISNAQFDYYRDTGMETFKIYLSEIYLSLINFRTSYLTYLDNRND
jgi:spore coat protein H